MFNLDDYEPVESRIKAFWEKYPDGRLHTELVHFDSSNFIIKAMAFTDRTDTVADDAGQQKLCAGQWLHVGNW